MDRLPDYWISTGKDIDLEKNVPHCFGINLDMLCVTFDVILFAIELLGHSVNCALSSTSFKTSLSIIWKETLQFFWKQDSFICGKTSGTEFGMRLMSLQKA